MHRYNQLDPDQETEQNRIPEVPFYTLLLHWMKQLSELSLSAYIDLAFSFNSYRVFSCTEQPSFNELAIDRYLGYFQFYFVNAAVGSLVSISLHTSEKYSLGYFWKRTAITMSIYMLMVKNVFKSTYKKVTLIYTPRLVPPSEKHILLDSYLLNMCHL